MNKFVTLAALCLSGSAFAQMCEVELVKSNGQVVQTYQSDDGHADCKEAMKACRFEIRQRGRLGRMNCVPKTDDRVRPVPSPNPGPFPVPAPRRDAQRHIQNGESVVWKSTYVNVIGASMNGRYAVKSFWGQITRNIDRENLAVTSGCTGDLCVNEQVISLASMSYVNVAALEYDMRFVTKTIGGQLATNVDRIQLAKTSGCTYARHSQICVGNQVLTPRNDYLTVAGIQANGQVVLKSIWGQLRANVNVDDLIVTR